MKSQKEQIDSISLFIDMSEKTLVHVKVGTLVIPTSREFEIAFHKIHARLLPYCESGKIQSRMSEWYPFFKSNNRWMFGVQRFYMYLFYARQALYRTGEKRLMRLSDAVVNATAYTDRVNKIGWNFRPTSFDNWDDYQKEITKIYESHLVEQMNIFDEIKETPVL